jgi:branched-chain amino acid transport system ATP-binding protein
VETGFPKDHVQSKNSIQVALMTQPILALEKISKRFGAIVIADGIDLELGEGEALGILGPNGAGKTTLFGIISGTVQPDSGRVLYAGTDITQMSPERRCALGIGTSESASGQATGKSGIGRSFQIPLPFSGMSVFENLVVASAFGARRREHDAYHSCMDILARCGLADKANRPAGSLTLLDRKRLELARALATDPAVLLLDEVAGGLTEHECQALIALIREVRKSTSCTR